MSRPPRERRRIGTAIGCGVVLLVAVLGIRLWPTPVDRGIRDGLEGALAWLHRGGLPRWFGYRQLEFTANIVMFVPVGLVVGALVPRGRAWIAAILPPALSVAIEGAQLLLLPERFATLSDVVANSAGGWIGAALALGIRRHRRRAR